MLIAAPRLSLVQIRALGTIGALAVAAGGSFAGSLPVGGPQLVALRTRLIGDHVDPAVVCVYLGLTLLVVAWWRLGRLLTNPEAGVTRHALLVTLVSWSAPLVLCPPLFSRDVYSYLAQGAMVRAGIDIYSHGPATLGGPLAAEVPAIWQDTPAPYGPVFVLYATAIAHVVGTNTVLGVFAMRAVALLGVAGLAVCLPWLARRCGASPKKALWLGVLNPLVLTHLVAGAHNDAVMLALLVAGLALVTTGRRVVGVTLIAMAALVKVPAVVGLLFVIPLWAAHAATRATAHSATRATAHSAARDASPSAARATVRWREVHAGLGTAAVAAGATVVLTAAAGTGFGWVHALGTPASPSNWSITSALARITARFLDLVGVGVAADVLELWRWVGLCVAVVAAVACWWQRERLGPVRALGLALGAIVLLGPALRPWYLLWAVVLLAVTSLSPRLLWAIAASCGVLAMVVLPNGFAPEYSDIGHAVLGVAMAIGALLIASALADREDWPLHQAEPLPQAAGTAAYRPAQAVRAYQAYPR
ncbi:polyprenol phosphomannose-dependent alpha 1,6 mannosyltransferase MptB [Actinopolymorpha sp. B17G11]|uniref:polyprenol phosphomannose-dependent alpha 1,6 mannosyltransferase MptB n=1 Tax=Actinopolymorpha sp. B17G11 TaxID=3160861 RepID=UPI0032E45213